MRYPGLGLGWWKNAARMVAPRPELTVHAADPEASTHHRIRFYYNTHIHTRIHTH
jgi:hypothetical protein